MNQCIKAESFNTTKWSGGSTTQLFIYPPTAEYQKRNFDFRLSSAKVEAEKSDFTSLAGISRKIMILDGELEISHEKHHKKKLRKFDQDSFEGNWKTSAVGRCTDFNLMTSSPTTGHLQSMLLHKKEHLDYTFNESGNWFFIYVFSGKLSIHFEHKENALDRGDLFVLNTTQVALLNLQAQEDCELIFAIINCPNTD